MFELRDCSQGVPASLGYRMPAEWEPHAATWLSWPRPDGISFPDAYELVMPAFAQMVDALSDSEPVCINVWDAAARVTDMFVFTDIPPMSRGVAIMARSL